MYVCLKKTIICTIFILHLNVVAYASLCEDQLFLLPNKVTYQSAVNLCKAHGLNLIRVEDEGTNQMVYHFSVQRGLGYYWIDANDMTLEGQWVYSDGEKIVYNKWHPVQPDNWQNEDCLHGAFYTNGFWNDIKCDVNMAVICYGDKQNGTIVTFEENQLVTLPDKVNHMTAINLCKAQGMNLVKIQTDAINTMVYNYAVQRRLGQYWIDANDIQTEGQWVYSDGKRITYSKWHPVQPDNWFKEDCLHGSFYEKGYWNDFKCDANCAVICYKAKEIPKIESKTKSKMESMEIFVSRDQLTYDDAVQYCKAKSMKLIQVDDAEVNKAILEIATRRRTGTYWIDGNDVKNSGIFTNSEGNSLKYKNFKEGDSTQSKDTHCIIGPTDKNEFWSYAQCDGKNTVLCFEETS